MMKKLLLLSMFLFNIPYVFSQIKTIKKESVTYQIEPYDSLINCLEKDDLEKYIGQTFYLPKATIEKEKGFRRFKKDIKGKTYKPIDRSSFAKTRYESVAGKYFQVIGVERNTRAYINDVYIHLLEKESGDELYYDFGKAEFPFIVQGYYEKMRRDLIGRTFFLDFGKRKECIDYYIEEGFTWNEILKFDDGTERIFGTMLLTVDKIGREVYAEQKRDHEIKERYGALRLGIDKNTCEIICGSPTKKNISEGEWGIHEQWVYEDKYIYFEDGKVTSIQYEK